MKRIITMTLLSVLFLFSFTACYHLPEPRPADFVEGDEIVIDNDTRFIYKNTASYEYDWYDVYALCLENDYSYATFAKHYGNKIIRHYKSATNETYYTVYSLENNRLLYLFLTLDENGDFKMAQETAPIDSRSTIFDMVFDYDQPAMILDGQMPDYCDLDYYTREEVADETAHRWELFVSQCDTVGLESYSSILNQSYETTDSFYRCIQYVSFDLVENDTSWNGLYSYDITFFKNGSGILHFRHFRHAENFQYTLEQEERILLTPEEISKLKTVITDSDFEKIPTWNPEEFDGLDGEITYILGGAQSSDVHLISMWEAAPSYGIYKIRTAIEEIVRTKIAVTSGIVYCDENK